MEEKSTIQLYDTEAFTAKFMPARELQGLLKSDFGKFFIVRVEEMYRLVRHPIPPSRATTHSCLYLTEGEATMRIGAGLYRIRKDEMLFVPAGQIFSFQDNDVNKGYLCNFHNDIFIGKLVKNHPLKDFEFLTIPGNPMISLDKPTSRFVRHIFSRMLFDYAHNGLNNLNIIQAYLVALLCEVNRAYRPLLNHNRTAAEDIAHRFAELVVANFRSRQRVADYASLLNITPGHLNKSVRAATGKSPARWIDEAIVLEAKVLLGQSRLAISQIASEVGIEDQSYFARLFRKYEGVTPSEYRRMIETS